MTAKEKREAFLKEYLALCNRYHLCIENGCGCCGAGMVTECKAVVESEYGNGYTIEKFKSP